MHSLPYLPDFLRILSALGIVFINFNKLRYCSFSARSHPGPMITGFPHPFAQSYPQILGITRQQRPGPELGAPAMAGRRISGAWTELKPEQKHPGSTGVRDAGAGSPPCPRKGDGASGIRPAFQNTGPSGYSFGLTLLAPLPSENVEGRSGRK